MDEPTRRNYQIEEQFADGKAESGFSYTFAKLDNPPMIMLELRMSNNETLRLFFEHSHFRDFANVVGLVERMLDAPSS